MISLFWTVFVLPLFRPCTASPCVTSSPRPPHVLACWSWTNSALYYSYLDLLDVEIQILYLQKQFLFIAWHTTWSTGFQQLLSGLLQLLGLLFELLAHLSNLSSSHYTLSSSCLTCLRSLSALISSYFLLCASSANDDRSLSRGCLFLVDLDSFSY